MLVCKRRALSYRVVVTRPSASVTVSSRPLLVLYYLGK